MKNSTVEILTIGNELLCGQTQDTNTHWMSLEMDQAGFEITQQHTVGDNKKQIMNALGEASRRNASIILITGGLGPTHDDITKSCLAEFFQCALRFDQATLSRIEQFFQHRHPLPTTHREQAMLPIDCDIIPNTLGTAQGMKFTRGPQRFIAMPGVPQEMKAMMTSSIIPALQKECTTRISYRQTICTISVGESWLEKTLATWKKNLPSHMQLSYLPEAGQVKLHLLATGNALDKIKAEVELAISQLIPLIGDHIYAFEKSSIEQAIGSLLSSKKLTLSAAESCTAGYLSHRITRIPGSSTYYRGGIIAYHNDIKIDSLRVPANLLREHGAVSKSVVMTMAEEVRKLFGTDIGVATSGIAGPGGGSLEKPVGTVWIAYADAHQTCADMMHISSNRQGIVERATVATFNLIRTMLAKR